MPWRPISSEVSRSEGVEQEGVGVPPREKPWASDEAMTRRWSDSVARRCVMSAPPREGGVCLITVWPTGELIVGPSGGWILGPLIRDLRVRGALRLDGILPYLVTGLREKSALVDRGEALVVARFQSSAPSNWWSAMPASRCRTRFQLVRGYIGMSPYLFSLQSGIISN